MDSKAEEAVHLATSALKNLDINTSNAVSVAAQNASASTTNTTGPAQTKCVVCPREFKEFYHMIGHLTSGVCPGGADAAVINNVIKQYDEADKIVDYSVTPDPIYYCWICQREYTRAYDLFAHLHTSRHEPNTGSFTMRLHEYLKAVVPREVTSVMTVDDMMVDHMEIDG